LFRAGLKILVTEIPEPLAVRRLVSFSEAVFRGEVEVEGVSAILIHDIRDAAQVWQTKQIPVYVDPQGESIQALAPGVVIDARMLKKPPKVGLDAAPLVIGLGPGFIAGTNSHAVIETKRGHTLGRVIWEGAPEPDTGVPESVNGKGYERVLRAPATGTLKTIAVIGEYVQAGQTIAEVEGHGILTPFDGVLRGLLRNGAKVRAGLKIGDVDPRADPEYCRMVSDKSLAIGGGVLEAILSKGDLRASLWD
jgi:xanthine dehydrogenase accessory factor